VRYECCSGNSDNGLAFLFHGYQLRVPKQLRPLDASLMASMLVVLTFSFLVATMPKPFPGSLAGATALITTPRSSAHSVKAACFESSAIACAAGANDAFQQADDDDEKNDRRN
jgi:hypothetical protein